MKTKVYLFLIPIIFLACSAHQKPSNIKGENKQIYCLTFDIIKKNAGGVYPEKITILSEVITEGQRDLRFIITKESEELLKEDAWKFVFKVDSNKYQFKDGLMTIKAKDILGKDVKVEQSSNFWYRASPIIFNSQKTKAYLYYTISKGSAPSRGPSLLLFSKGIDGWKVVAENAGAFEN